MVERKRGQTQTQTQQTTGTEMGKGSTMEVPVNRAQGTGGDANKTLSRGAGGTSSLGYHPYRRPLMRNMFDLDLYDPFASATDLFGSPWKSSTEMSSFMPRCDITDTPQEIRIYAETPGMKKEDIHIEVDDKGKYLNMRGETKQEFDETKENYRHVERHMGKFERRFKLPKNAKPDDIKAVMNNGLLTLTIPKSTTEQTQTRKINIS